MTEPQATPSTVLAAYLERFIDGRRVIVFGNCKGELASRLLERGARLVHVYDTDVGRVAEATARGASQDVTFAPLGEQGVAVRDGAFDLGIIENMAAHANPGDLVRRMRRALAARGALVVASPNPEAEAPLVSPPAQNTEGPSYYELYDLVGAEFDEVAMVGQTPFLGYALANFQKQDSNEFSIDTGFVPGGAEECDWFLAVGSHFPLELDAFSVIQMEVRALLPRNPAQGGSQSEIARLQKKLEFADQRLLAAEEELNATRDSQAHTSASTQTSTVREQALRVELEALRAEIETRKDELARAQAALEEQRLEVQKVYAKGQPLQVELDRVQAELAERTSWITELEERAATADARADQAEEALDELRNAHLLGADASPADGSCQQPDASAGDKLQQAASDNESLTGELAARSEELERLRAELAARDAELLPLRRQLEQQQRKFEEERAEFEQQRSELEEQRSAFEQQRSELEHLRDELASARNSMQDVSRDAASLEATLRQQAQRVRTLESELQTTERFAQELLARTAEPESAGEMPELPELQEQLNSLAARDAQRVADLQAAEWTIDELQRQLGSP